MCPMCLHSEKRRADDSTIQTYCKKEDKFVFKGGYCKEIKPRQCTLCVNKKLDAQSFPCVICSDFENKPYFVGKVVE